jgi:hypothetical protein
MEQFTFSQEAVVFRHFWKRTILALAWAQLLGLAMLVVYVVHYQPVIVDRGLAPRDPNPAYLEAGIARAASGVRHAALDVTSALDKQTPDHPGDASPQFDALFSRMDGLDVAMERYYAESTLVAQLGPAAMFPLSSTLALMLLVMIVVAMGLLIGQLREEAGAARVTRRVAAQARTK